MVSRATWRGFLKLSLVSCAVSLYPASQPSRVVAKTINRKTGNRVRRVFVDALTNEVVESVDQGRGFVAPPLAVAQPAASAPRVAVAARPAAADPAVASRMTPGPAASSVRPLPARSRREAPAEPPPMAVAAPEPVSRPPEPTLVEVGGDELRALDAENTHTIEIEQFCARSEVDWRYLDTPYYIGPSDRTAAEAFSVIRATMHDDDVAGIGSVVLARRERPILIVPCGNGLVGILLRFAEDVRRPDAIFEGATEAVSAEMQELAHIIIERKTGGFDPERFQNRHRQAVAELIRAKQEGGSPIGAEAPVSNVVSIMDALRRSISAEPAPAPAASKTRPSRSTKSDRKA